MVQFFRSDNLQIAYIDQGEGEPILLIHGFASNHRVNWMDTLWVRDLLAAGRRVIALDNRGHGQSDKPHDPAAYGTPAMAADACRLLDHLGIERADVMGYSMGARITAFLALDHPERVRRAVLAGLGAGLLIGVGAPQPIADALLAPSIDDVTTPQGRMFRMFAEQTRSDREALAACILASRQVMTEDELRAIRVPVLVAVGTTDDVAGPPEPIADLIPDSRIFHIQGRDHMKAVGDRTAKKAVMEFLSEA
ncbi:Pimeloyl-ACP methyl ester carboxylesterase [Faunimonas pinastri]|uniref:Pimeloyl-ACP methyl ester carboxylesterase n=1 Tax=Faunimonas pinastri TaxID=1855383 RepID=A0A1H9DBT7_9HYPH|nr:alpha/beta hydrolase [Faunimonas pinastri]SEQ10831.1 Pimeloyl-ACP methyl ester carboxylesterase [Faunimonas pinastri]